MQPKPRNLMKSLLLVATLIFSFSISVVADTIRLKDGSIIKGRITGFSGGKFTVTVGEGERQRVLNFDAAEVESIEFDGAAVTSARTSPIRVVTTDQTISGSSRTTPETAQPRVVTSDSTATSTPPVPRPTPQPTPRPVATPVPTTRASTAQPIEINVRVLADDTNNGWTNSGWVVRKGQRIRILASGEVSLGGGVMTGPSGLYEAEDSEKLMPAVPTGALIAVIGDDNNDFIYIGREREFVAQRDGALFLGLNEGDLSDNTGAFEVRIEISPEN